MKRIARMIRAGVPFSFDGRRVYAGRRMRSLATVSGTGDIAYGFSEYLKTIPPEKLWEANRKIDDAVYAFERVCYRAGTPATTEWWVDPANAYSDTGFLKVHFKWNIEGREFAKILEDLGFQWNDWWISPDCKDFKIFIDGDNLGELMFK